MKGQSGNNFPADERSGIEWGMKCAAGQAFSRPVTIVDGGTRHKRVWPDITERQDETITKLPSSNVPQGEQICTVLKRQIRYLELKSGVTRKVPHVTDDEERVPNRTRSYEEGK